MALLTGLLLPVLLMTTALGIEVTFWSVAKLELQRTADVAAWAGAAKYSATLSAQGATNAAADVAEINGVASASRRTWDAGTMTTTDNLITAQVVSGVRQASDMAVQVTVKRTILKLISAIFPSAASSVTITAVATAEVTKTGPCVVALSTWAREALKADNSGVISSSGCGIQSNSTASDAVYLNSATISGPSVRAVGGFSISNRLSNTLAPSPGAQAVADPFAARTAPIPGVCGYTNGNFTAYRATPYSFTQATNVFCGDTTIGGKTSSDTFAPGIYYVVNGNLTFNNASITSAVGVTFVLTGSAPGALRWSNDSKTPTQMTAPTSGPTAGIVFWQTCFGSTASPANTMMGGSSLNLSGAFYAPCGALNVSNNAALGTLPGRSMSVVAATISAAGSASIAATASDSASVLTSAVALVQ